MDAAIQTDHVDSQELWNLLIQQENIEQENHQTKRRHSGEDTSSGLMKHYPRQQPQQQQQDPDAILTDGGDIPRCEMDETLERNPSVSSNKVRSKQQPSKISFARGSKKCPSETKPSAAGNNNNNNNGRGKHSSEQSLSDRICQVVWSRKESAPFVTPLGSRRLAHARRGTAPNVPLMRYNFETKPDAFGGRSQSFKGSSSSGSVKKRIASFRDPLSRRASGDTVPTSEASSVAYRALLHPLKAKNKVGRHGDFNCSEEIGIGNESDYHRRACRIIFGQSFDSNSLHSSVTGSGQNLSFPTFPPTDPLERKMGGLHVHGSSCKSQNGSHDGDGDSHMRRQVSMTLSIPSREDSVRSCSSSKSYGSYSAIPARSASPVFPCTSSSINSAIAATSKLLSATSNVAGGQMKPSSMGKLVRYGSNPDVFSSRRAKREHETLRKQSNRGKVAIQSPSRSLAGSNCNIEAIFPGMTMANSITNLEEKKKQILSQKNKRNERVAWAVHLGFSSLLILAITCIVVFLRISSSTPPSTSASSNSYYSSSSNMTNLPSESSTFNSPNSSNSIPSNDFSNVSQVSSFTYNDDDDDDDGDDNMTLHTHDDGSVRKENENLLQSIQPQLTLHNITTPQPSPHTQVYDNSNGNEDSGQSILPNLQNGQSLTRTKEELAKASSSSSSDSSQVDDGDGQQKSNNATIPENLNIMTSTGRREGEEGGGSTDRSNNNDSSKMAGSSSNNNNSNSSNINKSINNNPSIKSNSIRPKRSRSRPKSEDSSGDMPSAARNSNIIISVLNESVHTSNAINDTPSSGLMKARHLESTIFRFLKNSSGSGMRREGRNLDLESRKL